MGPQSKQSDPLSGGQNGPPPGGTGSGPSAADRPRRSGPPPGTYLLITKGPVHYLPVTLTGEVIGYLWASPTEKAGGYVRRLTASEEAFRSPVTWSERMRESYGEGLSALQALRRWQGAPEDPQGGAIAADAEEGEAASLAELYELANPGGDPPPDSLGPEGTFPDGTPMDRSKGWGDLSPFTLEKPGYSFQADSAVRYLPVTKGGEVLGYLWASGTEDAADYQRRLSAGAEGFRAGRLWISRLDQCKKEGLPPLDALRRWIGVPEDPEWGGVAADAQEQEAPSLDALKEIAGR
ncbi:hypothetical protein [Actinomadura alba]|uniref:hypothetical protein n=1 Tax=Actinomadura alba TaxID=406431 RepID=UPI00165098CF|nr:hypothetical protein [Actinomadura alba]